jgi:hypothetical protein
VSVDVEDKLWNRDIARAAEWSDVARYLVDRLSDFLGQAILVDEITPVDESSFTCSVHGDTSTARPLEVMWRGVIGMEPIDGHSLVTATLIPFLLGQRLKIDDHARSTIDLVFEKRPGAPGHWTPEGWQEDEYGEWDELLAP